MRKLYVGALGLLSAVLMMIGLCLFDAAQNPNGQLARSMRHTRQTMDAHCPHLGILNCDQHDPAELSEAPTGTDQPAVAGMIGQRLIEVIDLTQMDNEPVQAVIQSEPPLAGVIEADTTDPNSQTVDANQQAGEETADSGSEPSEAVNANDQQVCPAECLVPVDVVLPACATQQQALEAAAAKAIKLMQMRQAAKAKKLRKHMVKPSLKPKPTPPCKPQSDSHVDEPCQPEEPCQSNGGRLPCQLPPEPGCLTYPNQPTTYPETETECDPVSPSDQPSDEDQTGEEQTADQPTGDEPTSDEPTSDEHQRNSNGMDCPEPSDVGCPMEMSYPLQMHCPSYHHGGCTRGCTYSPGCMRFYPTVPTQPEPTSRSESPDSECPESKDCPEKSKDCPKGAECPEETDCPKDVEPKEVSR